MCVCLRVCYLSGRGGWGFGMFGLVGGFGLVGCFFFDGLFGFFVFNLMEIFLNYQLFSSSAQSW